MSFRPARSQLRRHVWIVGLLIFSAVRLVSSQDSTDFAQRVSQARSLLGQQQPAQAEALLRKLVAEQPDKPGPHYLLGYALQSQQKYEEALKSYAEAAKDPRLKANALYNMACVASLQNDADTALAHLQDAITAGFANFGQLASDNDFANLREDERFKKLLPRQLADEELFVEPTRVIHKFVGENAGDQFGWTARRVGDWDGDGVTDFVSTAPTHNNGAGKVYVYSSRTGKLLWSKAGQAGEQFGNSAVGCGDVNGDGVLDLIVGAPNRTASGNAYVFSGADGELIHHFRGHAAGDRFGVEVSELGDLDGDGHADVLVGSDAGQGQQSRAGRVFVYSGKTGAVIFELEGEESGDNFGNAAAAQKNADGTWTLAVGAQNAGSNDRGKVYVYTLSNGVPQTRFTIDGDANSVNLGQMFISFPGDLDGDGRHDIYASDFSDNTAAAGGGKVVVCSGDTGQPLLTITGKQAGEGLGTSPSDAGDVNGDAIGDLVIGAWQKNEGAPSGGKVYLVDGKTGARLKTWTCRQAGDTFGFDACGIGDVDGDGKVDFLLTSAWSNTRGPKTGRVFIIAGE